MPSMMQPRPSTLGKSPTSKSKRIPKLRDSKEGYKTILAFVYALTADLLGIYWMIQPQRFILQYPLAILLAVHGRIVASYLVHEATHDSIFTSKEVNRWFGISCVWLAGCPYCNFGHIQKMHISHHKDRTDLVEFDYRSFVQNIWSGGIVKTVCCVGEFCFVPVIETLMHLRQALGPIVMGIFFPQHNEFFTPARIKSACLGTPVQIAFFTYLWYHGALWMQLLSGAMVVHLLAFGDAFHHTYEAVFPQDYTPGPANRTAQFEEDNTYSNLISTRYPILNQLSLNFAYHNAHHKRPMVPWYQLPDYHEKLYATKNSNGSKEVDCPQVLPISQVFAAWYTHRLRRVVEEEYGVVYPAGTPNRARDFVGTLGASFLTV